MDDLIMREVILEFVRRCKDRLQGKGLTYEILVDYIKAIPSIDAVEVVRCKECRWLRYCETEELDLYLDCDKPDGGGIPRSEDWFCADGEREERE